MARDTTDEAPISGVEEMAAYLASGCKPREQWRIGTEHEKFPFFTDDNAPVPYHGDRSIKALLEGMQKELGWEPIIDEGNIIGLFERSGMGAISLEPGGQFELSGAPLETLHQTCGESNLHLKQLRAIADPLGIKFLGLGASPKWTLSETPQMPKSRYDIMRRYMPKVGTQGLDMMHRTSTIQVNLDFDSEADMRKKMQMSYRLQPIATALFANSPFTNGKPNGMVSWRADIWRDTDNNRSGVLPMVFNDNFGFADYVEWALDVPMYFVMRDGKYVDCTHVTFRQFMAGALKGQVADAVPNKGDWTNHLSTVFPEVRLKKFIEMRGADGGPWRRICALPAFWVGLCYDDTALESAWQLTKDWSFDDVNALRNAVPKEGLNAKIKGRSVLDVAKDVLAISRAGLTSRAKLNSEGFDEAHFLAPLEEVAARGSTSAEQMLTKYHSVWEGSVEPVFLEYAY
ncbi:MAG: glutamate--cysteine ligase [Ahrensia sp.]|nr:glutamate--cysteine ligase [Ahrensia sp.]